MATLHKFKLLATQCAVAGSPTRSPTTSPVIHLRRRKTLRMFLTRNNGDVCSRLPPCDRSTDRRLDSPEKGKEIIAVRHKLKDLFVSSSSSPPPLLKDKAECEEFPATSSRATSDATNTSTWRCVGPRSMRPLSTAFRQRLLRRPWRPVLISIPE